MTSTSNAAVGQTYVLLREAAKLMRGPAGDALHSDVRIKIAALQLLSLSLVGDFRNDCAFTPPATVAACLELAEIQTSAWDLGELPDAAMGFVLALAELNRALSDGRRS
ncbi:hypothetical protein [Tessaracoccus antarcticus]|uniref:Uncharacterized protein n=1 Tax=Tessaracoccus antarcticus TaxID=2479848 RepID=A0A3M0FYM6_9ACTN|nr:hypothetical protein [Tessaracoccus antarcticus]RMB57840.1 hypothetical protein EAX62_15410 [Tessaracoccus antarcticus]